MFVEMSLSVLFFFKTKKDNEINVYQPKDQKSY